MDYKGNKITRNAWSWLNVNEAKIVIEDDNKINKDNKDKDNKDKDNQKNLINKKIDRNFEKIEHGVSKEIVELNRENLDKYIFLDGSDLSEDNINNKTLINNKNIIHYPKSRSGAMYLKIQNTPNTLLDINLKENIEAKYILEFKEVLNLVIRIYLEKNSKLDLILIDKDEKKNLKLESIATIVENNASVEIIKVDFNKSEKYFNYSSNLIEENAESTINLAYVLSGKEKYDMSFHQKYMAKNTKGDILVEGVLKDESYKIFKGTLDFLKGSKGSVGNEDESLTNYSKNTTAISLPILLAHEDDIKGTHASNHGDFDKEQLYYIQSRGFSKEEAKNIVAEAKITPILDKVQNRDLKLELKEVLKKKLES